MYSPDFRAHDSDSSTPDADHGLTGQLVSYLLLRTSVDDVAQFAVHHLLDRLHVWHLSIFSCSSEGQLTRIGSFGRPDSMPEWDLDGRNCFNDPNFDPSLSKGQPQSTFPLTGWTSHDQGRSTEVHAIEAAHVLWPLATPARMVGLLHASFLTIPDPDLAVADISGIAPVLSLLAMHSSAPEPGEARRQAPAHLSRADEPLASLSQRQLRILELMCDGMTNEQISREIRFSASTVRQETMVIYRYLGVSGRAEATVEALQRGLVASDRHNAISG